jgi:ribosomal protein L7/L12
MNRASETLIERIKTAKSLEAARAYADAIQIVESQFSLVSVELVPGAMRDAGYPFIEVIKEIRKMFNTGLRESKDLVEKGHTWRDLTMEEAKKMTARLNSVGATTKLLV